MAVSIRAAHIPTYPPRSITDTAIDLMPCDNCGRLTPFADLDGKPEPGSDPETSDWTRLECEDCYGPGYWSNSDAFLLRHWLETHAPLSVGE